jgi:hypothetical protein
MEVSQDLVIGFRGNEKEIVALCARRTHRERTLRDDWQVVDGNWRRAGAEKLPCELVREQCFLGKGVLAKQLRSRGREWELRAQDGVGEAGEARSVLGVHPIQVMALKC